MTLEQMIEVLQAAQRGEQIYYRRHDDKKWVKMAHCEFNFSSFDYRIAPKKELSLVEELREYQGKAFSDIRNRAADRIEELESHAANWAPMLTTDQLLDEIKRRMK
jgi:hypothetical protein